VQVALDAPARLVGSGDDRHGEVVSTITPRRRPPPISIARANDERSGLVLQRNPG
jgi:hypothetical protein